MITDKNPHNWDYTEHEACKNCGRTKDLKKIYIKSGSYDTVLCFCKKCWAEITDKIWPEYRRKKNER